jgi:hypothetical protein
MIQNPYYIIETLRLLRCPFLSNEVFPIIANNCKNLTALEIGGSFNDYNHLISLEGF